MSEHGWQKDVLDLVTVARGCGIEDAFHVCEPPEVRGLVERIGAPTC